MADSCTIAQEIVGKAGLVTLLFQRSVNEGILHNMGNVVEAVKTVMAHSAQAWLGLKNVKVSK
jgi:hypothetical protein